MLALEPKVEGRSARATVRLLASNATLTARCLKLGEKYEVDAAAAARAAEKAARKVTPCRLPMLRASMAFCRN